MDDLVASSSSRALLTLSQRWLASMGWVLLLGSGVLAMREMVLEISSREVSAISASSGVLTWDDVSTSLEGSLSLWGGCVSTTMGFGLLGLSSLTHDQTCLTSPNTGDSLPPWSC